MNYFNRGGLWNVWFDKGATTLQGLGIAALYVSSCPHRYSHTNFGSYKLCKHKCIILCVWHRHLYTHYTTLHRTHVEKVSIQTWLKHRVSREQHFIKKKRGSQSHSKATVTHTYTANSTSGCTQYTTIQWVNMKENDKKQKWHNRRQSERLHAVCMHRYELLNLIVQH